MISCTRKDLEKAREYVAGNAPHGTRFWKVMLFAPAPPGYYESPEAMERTVPYRTLEFVLHHGRWRLSTRVRLIFSREELWQRRAVNRTHRSFPRPHRRGQDGIVWRPGHRMEYQEYPET